MKPKTQQQLYDKYPEIFRQKDLPMNQTAMMWGICVSQGWYTILDELCSSIQNHIRNKNYNIEYKKKRGELPQDAPNFPQVEATQVKEKFGGLRFYVNHSDEYIDGLISMAEAISTRTCEQCGNPGEQNDNVWITTMCEPCRTEDDARRNKLDEQYLERLTVKMNDVTVAP
jgi:hypothetical protein